MSKMTIVYTWQCNYKCPFCIVKTNNIDRIKDLKVWTNDTKNKCFDFILNNNIKYVSIMGGEPLVYPNECKDIINFCKKHGVKVFVYTNASLLTSDLVNFFNENDVHVAFSLNYYGYKNIEFLIRKAKDKNIISLIKSLKYKSIRTVYNKKHSLALEATILHNLFDCYAEFSYDFSDPDKLDHTELDDLENALDKLCRYHKDLSWFRLVPFGTKYANDDITFYPNGTILDDRYREGHDYTYYGHSKLAKRLPIDIYNRYICIAERVAPRENRKSNDDLDIIHHCADI